MYAMEQGMAPTLCTINCQMTGRRGVESVSMIPLSLKVDSGGRRWPTHPLLPPQQPLFVGGELELLLTNIEHTFTEKGFQESCLPQRLLSVLPAEAADILARQSSEQALAMRK